jgi:hypothetical protein
MQQHANAATDAGGYALNNDFTEVDEFQDLTAG